VGKVHIVEAPVGAVVSIDGESRATTPLDEPLVLDPGRHIVKISKDKFKTLSVEVVVASGAEIEVRADLENPRAEVKVSCEGDRTVIFVDDAAVGSCPYHGEVSAGVHELKVIEPGKETFTKTIEVTAGATLVIEVDLKPVIEPNPPTFISEPVASEVSKLNWGLKVGGITALGLSAVSFGLGGLFTSKWNKAYDAVEESVDVANNENRPDRKDAYESAYEKYEDDRDTAEGYRSAMAASYAIGAGFLAVGTALFIWSLILDRKDESDTPLSVQPIPGGVVGSF
jgi:hypothetical protein